MNRRSKLAAVVLALILTADCGGSVLLKSFRLALAASAPLVNSLVAAGAIPQAKAAAIIADFDAGAQCGLTLQTAFAAIPSELPSSEKRGRKLQASVAALQCFRVIINRQNFAANQRIQTAANIAEGILESLVAFYSGSADRTAAVQPQTEKDLEKHLEKRVDALKAAMKP